MLNLKKAILLYEILEPYIPDKVPDDAMEFIEKVLEDKENGSYARALSLMTEHSMEELSEFSPEYNMKMFIEGIVVNDIFTLKKFCENFQ